ncbi:MAG: hypothetical protein IT582_05350 [Opitutaceae bacterium]|nr:hypothetical protein [Opitutaceae bacterium]
MKLIKALEITAVVGIAAFAVSAALGDYSSVTIALATVPLLLVCLLRDYTPRQSRWEPTPRPVRFTATTRPVRRAVHQIAA